MYQTHKTYIRPEHPMLELLNENPSLLLVLEHLDIDFCVSDRTVEQICRDSNTDLPVFLIIANLYNGFFPNETDIGTIKDLSSVIRFLKNSHRFYRDDKYPEIKSLINKLKETQDSETIRLIEQFFSSYFNEVLEHFDYEDTTAFPYFNTLIENKCAPSAPGFSASEYRDHHSDIETKLDDLRNLLLKHMTLKGDLPVRRKFLYSLSELEADLRIHSIIEERILIPLAGRIEKKRNDG